MIGPSILAVALICLSLAQLSFKLSYVRKRRLPYFLGALFLFGITQIGFYGALTHLSVGVVYMSTGIAQILILALSRFVLRERITSDHLVAVMLIIGGLVVYAT